MNQYVTHFQFLCAEVLPHDRCLPADFGRRRTSPVEGSSDCVASGCLEWCIIAHRPGESGINAWMRWARVAQVSYYWWKSGINSPVEVGSLSRHLQGFNWFYTSRVVQDFFHQQYGYMKYLHLGGCQKSGSKYSFQKPISLHCPLLLLLVQGFLAGPNCHISFLFDDGKDI